MALVERDRSPDEVVGVERSFEVRLGSLGGFEVRPTRLFLWKGPERDAQERLVALGERPSALDYPHRETTTRAGAVEVRSLGNPLMTLALASVVAFKKWVDAPEG